MCKIFSHSSSSVVISDTSSFLHPFPGTLRFPQQDFTSAPAGAAVLIQSSEFSCLMPWHQLDGADILSSLVWKHFPHCVVFLETTSPFLLLVPGMRPGASLNSGFSHQPVRRHRRHKNTTSPTCGPAYTAASSLLSCATLRQIPFSGAICLQTRTGQHRLEKPRQRMRDRKSVV